MSSRCQTYTILTCDNCGKTLSSLDAGLEIASAPAARAYASKNGWRFVAVIIPMPPEHHGRDTKRRHFDFCDQCGIPEQIHTTIQTLVTRPLGPGFMDVDVPITILSGVVLYGATEPEKAQQ